MYFYLPEGSLNEATVYYTDLIKKGLERSGYSIKVVKSIDSIEKSAEVLTIRSLDQIKLKKTTKKLVNWFQGIGPEEYRLLHGFSFNSKIISKYLEYLEKKSLKKSNLCIFVSEKMKTHYEEKYKLDLSRKSLVIPCYNINFEEKFFQDSTRYEKLNFVYAGGIFAWQCIDETLLLFKKIYELNQSANLTLLTSNVEEARNLVEKYKVCNVEVDYVKLEDLQERLSLYSYGFLIRKDDLINKVSTPTKMNSYLAAGLIPIYTDAIDSFEKNINLKKFELKFKATSYNVTEVADEILDFHENKKINNDFIEVYKDIFDEYYNDEKYISMIKDYIDNGRF